MMQKPGFKDSAIARGDKIKELRSRRGDSQDSLTASANGEFSIETLRRAERNMRISKEKLEKIANCLGVEIGEIMDGGGVQKIIEAFQIDLPQKTIGLHIAKAIGVDENYYSFNMYETTGDICPDRSRIVLKDQSQIKFDFDIIDTAFSNFLRKNASKMLEQGFVLSSSAVEGWIDRWGQDQAGELDTNIILLIERGDPSYSSFDSDLLGNALIHYAFEVPDDCADSVIKGLPRPSLSGDVFDELVKREDWDQIKTVFVNIAGRRDAFIYGWGARVMDQRENIENPQIKKLLAEACKLAEYPRPRTEAFLNLWFETF